MLTFPREIPKSQAPHLRQNGHPHTLCTAPLETEKGVEFQAEKNRMLDEIVSHNCTYSANQTMVDREVNDRLNAE